MDEAYFKRGETVAEFVSSLGEQRERFEELLGERELSEAGQRQAQGLPGGLRVVVIAEPWSGDVLYFLPPLVKLAEAAGWEVRIFRRDQYPELIEPYRKEGLYRSIPVFVFYDRQFGELGHWIERPAQATQVIEAESLKLRRRLRAEHQQEWQAETLREVAELVAGQG